MPARRCDECDKNWEAGKGRVHCPLCGAPLVFKSKLDGDERWPLEPLPPIDPELEQEIAAGWHDLKAEAERRGVSPADVLELRDWSVRKAS